MVNISNKSKELIKETFSRYTERELPDFLEGIKIDGRTIIHTYPTEDTQNDENEELSGYADCLLFDIYIYDVKNKIFYKSKGHDTICYSKFPNISQKIFKDGSTMVVIDKPVNIFLTQAVTIFNREEY